MAVVKVHRAFKVIVEIPEAAAVVDGKVGVFAETRLLDVLTNNLDRPAWHGRLAFDQVMLLYRACIRIIHIDRDLQCCASLRSNTKGISYRSVRPIESVVAWEIQARVNGWGALLCQPGFCEVQAGVCHIERFRRIRTFLCRGD